MIPQETVDLIIDTARIEDVVSDYVTLKRRGANLVACCPFHNEKTPSFYVSPAKGIYKCFGCGKAGNVTGFVMEQEHCTFTEALKYLARKYNIEIREKEESAEEIARRQLNESLLLVSEFARKFYSDQLKSGEGHDVGLAYYRKRGIEDETIQRFGLGWAPSGRTALLDAARAAGYKQEYLLEAGLAVQHEDGSVTDKFRERVMFPIHSVSGRVVAFSGRTLRSDNPAKYVNSPETRIYVKSRNLLGIYFAKAEISRMQKCILVEGNVDMVMMHQLGIKNVVASCGTSLTIEQIRLIHKFTENVTIMYDGDSAGIHAALRGINMVLSEGLNVKIVLLPEGDDPDSYSRRHTLEEVQAYIAGHETDFIGFKTELLLNEAAGDPLKKANLVNDLADTIAEIPDPVKRTMYVEDTASRFGIESSILFRRINDDRKKMKDDAYKEAERQRRLEEREQPLEVHENEDDSIVFENRTQALAERDLMAFLMTNGCDFLDFESDSEYYSGSEDEKLSVADFIRSALDADGASFANSIYRKLYDSYMTLYYDGYPQEEIVRRMINSPDCQSSRMAVELSTEKYELTVSAFSNALMTTSSWLVAQVPKAIMVFQERRLQSRIDEILLQMRHSEGDAQISLMKELVKTQAVQRRIKQKIGREKQKDN